MEDKRFFWSKEWSGHLLRSNNACSKYSYYSRYQNKLTRLDVAETSSPIQRKSDNDLTLKELTLAAMCPNVTASPNCEFLKQNSNGNVVLSALSLATRDKELIVGCTLPDAKKIESNTRLSKERRKVSFGTKCPIAKSLKKAVEKQNERERYWLRKQSKQNNDDMKYRKESKTTSDNITSVETRAMFQHIYQKYDKFLIQENEDAHKRKVFAWLKRSRMSTV